MSGTDDEEPSLGERCWQIERHLSLWRRGVELQAERFTAAAAGDDIERLELETHFYAEALHQVFRGGEWAERDLEGEPERRAVASAVNRFRREVRDVKAVRDMLAHSIAYDSGADPDGSKKKNPSIPTPTPRYWTDGGVFRISSSRKRKAYTLAIAESAREGVRMADAVRRALTKAMQRFNTERAKQ